ncbi:exonuclease domain-containing protein [Accumulibacter sp.]|uniref:3'-5' exonuclease n=1 Tax=Accumulibacter sp. TaxID=2053492 RepID=UPI0025DAC400|nr:exonuclease domain-containing protein [Accumulibacter sp.]MCM8626934.1 exonuclease domain-containing protein [Accumulibacter sp.]
MKPAGPGLATAVLALRRLWHRHRLRARSASPLLTHLAAPLADRRQDWRQARYLALDLETTGSDAQRDDILSFGWVCLDGPEIRLDSARHRLVLPRGLLDEASVSVHRITDDRAAGGQRLEDVLAEFLEALADRVLIAHYTPTELRFIDAACRACFGGPFLPLAIDTLDLARRTMPGPERGSLRLAALRARHHLPRYAMHHALSDALAAAELFLAQAAKASAQGRRTLGDFLLG